MAYEHLGHEVELPGYTHSKSGKIKAEWSAKADRDLVSLANMFTMSDLAIIYNVSKYTLKTRVYVIGDVLRR